MALLHSTSLYITLYHGSTSLYLTLHYSAMALLYAIWLWRMYLLQSYFDGEKDIEIQPGFEPGSYEFWSDDLTNWATAWSSGIGAEDRWYISIDTAQLSDSTLLYHGSTSLHLTLHDSPLALLHCTYFYHSSTSLYLTLLYCSLYYASTSLYFMLLDSTLFYHGSTSLHLTLH